MAASDGLNERQRKFVEAFLACGNASEAYRQAGYECKNDKDVHGAAARLSANVSVAAAIAEGRKKITEQAELTQQMVVDGLLTEARRTGEGTSHSARVSAWKALGEYMSMFDGEGGKGGRDKPEQISDEDRQRYIADANEQMGLRPARLGNPHEAGDGDETGPMADPAA